MSANAHSAGPDPGRFELRLSPASGRGWFGGEWLEATDPLDVAENVPLAEAAAALETAFEGRGDAALVAVLAAYDGTATVLRYASAETPASPAASAPGSEAPLGPAAPLLSDSKASGARRFRWGVRAVRDAIAAGDVYVLNLTYPLTGTAVLDGPGTYAALLGRAGADMAAYLATPSVEIASASPERFVRVRATAQGRVAEIWPIKGTCERGADAASDRELAGELAANAKERAEHVMVVDMERNDLGRVCVPGSVVVEPLLEVVPTPYCHQLVSRVRGIMRDGATFPQLLDATFPCGSITGAPKRAAMRIAASLEDEPRGYYTGALLVARPGELDSSVLIRTAVIAGDGHLTWGTGGGITIDSDPAGEYLETLLKASPLTGDGHPPVALRETCRVTGGRVPLLAYHLARLAAGGCGPTQLAAVRARVSRVIAETPGSGVARRARRLAITAYPDGTVSAELTGDASSLDVPGGPRLELVSVAVPPALPPAAAKPADRSAWDEAQSRAGAASQAVLVTTDGRLVDGATATVWVRRGSELLTPPSPPAVAGVAREVVFDIAGACGLGVSEAPLTAADLDSAAEVFFTNAYGGVVPAHGSGGWAAERLGAAWRSLLGDG